MGKGLILRRRWNHVFFLELLRGLQAPRGALCGTQESLRTMHGGGSAPSCFAFTHRVAFEEESGHGSLSRAGRAIGVVRHVALPMWLVSNFLVRPVSSCGAPGRPGNPSRPRRGIDSPVAIRRGEGAQMKQCRDPRCSPRGNPACQGLFGCRMKAGRDRFALQGRTGDFP